MPRRTKQLAVMPWTGGLVTAHDPALLEPEQLVNADNITMRFSHDKTRRDGINYNWDNSVFAITERASSGTTRTFTGTFTNTGLVAGDYVTIESTNTPFGTNNPHYSLRGVVASISSTTLTVTANSSYTEATTADDSLYWYQKVIGAYDYWFETDVSKAHWIISVLDNGMVFVNTDGGNKTRLTTIGLPWSVEQPLTIANMETINNTLVIAVDGAGNQMVYWQGDITQPLQDLLDTYFGIQNNVDDGTLVRITSINKSSSGSIRTIQFDSTLNILAGDTIVIKGDDPNYTGTYELASVSAGSLATITYAITGSLLDQSTTDDTSFNIGSLAPLAINLRQHLGALWCDDKTELDLLHYSGRDEFSWSINGTSDDLAGATLVGSGDGDSVGISGIAPSFQGVLFVGKRTKLYRIEVPAGESIDSLQVVKVSDDIGFLSHQSIAAVEQTDLVFASERGLHSMTTTNAYGNFLSNYLSADINRTFATLFTAVRKPYIKVCYVPEISGVLMAVSDNGSAYNNAVYGYNIDHKTWYRWTGIEAESICSSLDNSVRTIYLGGYRGRLLSTLTGTNFDTLYDGSNSAIPTKVTTGLLYLNNTSSFKGFKEVRVFLAPKPNYNIVVNAKIDNQAVQVFQFSNPGSTAPLGEMILGFDPLGHTSVSEPYALPIDGVGRAIQLTFMQNDYQDSVGILGYAVDYTEGDKVQETIDSDD